MSKTGLTTILVTARDAGAASALVPVGRTLLADRRCRMVVAGFRQAEAVFRHEGFPIIACEDDARLGVGSRLIEQQGPDAVLTGTSMKVGRDAAFWQAARRLGVPSMAVVDHWSNLGARFSSDASQPYDCLPDVIAVMDDVARSRMVSGGCPADRILVTGQPYFDDFDALAPAEQDALRDAARWALGVPDERAVIVFASEPQARFYGSGPSQPRWLGYTEAEVLEAVLEGLASVSTVLGHEGLQLIVKLHPLEGLDQLAPVASTATVPTAVLRHFPPRSLIAAADAVIGMSSVFILEAALMGRPALSLQLRREHSDGLIEHHSELIDRAEDAPECARFVARALRERRDDWAARAARAGALGYDGRAARRVVDELYRRMTVSDRRRRG